mmetsp:Transcript_78423/g.179417  ORF Transcript_78423/g.179417 Transcript_78423/m.179417 type:complete len:366 (-) Transcript_78423:460-1557(-)
MSSDAGDDVLLEQWEQARRDAAEAREQRLVMQEQLEELQILFAKVTPALKHRLTTVDSLQQEVAGLTRDNEQLLAKSRRLDEAEKRAKEATVLEATLKSVRAEALKQEQAFNVLTDGHIELQKTAETSAASLTEAEAKIVELKSQLQASEGKLTTASKVSAELVAARAALAESQASEASQQKALAAQKTQIDTLSRDLKQRMAMLQHYKNTAERAQAEAGQTADVRKQHEEVVAKLKAAEAAAADAQKGQAAHSQQAQQEVASLRQQVAALQADRQAAAGLREQLVEARAAAAAAQARVAETEGTAQQLRQELAEARGTQESQSELAARSLGLAADFQRLWKRKLEVGGEPAPTRPRLEGEAAPG